MPIVQSRRRFLTNVAFAGAAGIGGAGVAGLSSSRDSVAAEPPPETTKLRVWEGPVTCIAPQEVAGALLRSEGFTDVEYVTLGKHTQRWIPEALLSGEADISLSFIPSDLVHIDAGEPVIILAGSHIGCVELFGSERVGSCRDLKNKTVAITQPWSDEQIFVSMFAAYVGLDPHKDINWLLVGDVRDRLRLILEGKIDAFMWGPPLSLELREKESLHVLTNTTLDTPWSQYFCCLIASTKEFVRQHPVATKRALRAILKGADVCASEPERVARLIVERNVPPFFDWPYDYVLKMLQEIPYGQWRDYDPEDSLRFYALRMHELGFIKNSPQKIIDNNTDWRFFNQLKRELKA